MSSCHRPRIYRSIDGCCICGAKSSSSRFTSSSRYEQHFEQCFALDEGERRSGDICNACVLLVKRFRKLPFGSTRCWSHVKDARTGPGLKSINKLKYKKAGSSNNTALPAKKLNNEISLGKENAAKLKHAKLDFDGLDDEAAISDADEYSECSSGGKEDVLEGGSEFIDSKYWKRLTVCCGVVYRGAYGECLLDAACYRPCSAHANEIQATDCKSTAVTNSKVASVDSGNEESNSVDDLIYADSYSIDAVASEVDVAMDLSVRGAVADVVPRAALPTTMRLLAVNEV